VAAVVFPASFTAEEERAASEVLGELCSFLGLRLGLEACHEREQFLLREHRQQTALCVLADMVGPVSHELQNVFNNIVLQAAILAREVPGEVRPDVDVMRRLGVQASQMMNRLDEYRHRLNVPREPVDLNRIIARVLDELPAAPGVTVEQDLDPLPPVLGNDSDLGRLLRLLVSNARAVLEVQGGGAVTVRTEVRDRKVLLRVEDTGPSVEDDPGKVLEPFVLARPGENSLELGACQGLARKLKARIRAENLSPRGLAVSVELDVA